MQTFNPKNLSAEQLAGLLNDLLEDINETFLTQQIFSKSAYKRAAQAINFENICEPTKNYVKQG